MRKQTIALQPSSQPQTETKCATCRHLTDLTHDCRVHRRVHRCVMSEHDGRVVVHECSGYWRIELEKVPA